MKTMLIEVSDEDFERAHKHIVSGRDDHPLVAVIAMAGVQSAQPRKRLKLADFEKIRQVAEAMSAGEIEEWLAAHKKEMASEPREKADPYLDLRQLAEEIDADGGMDDAGVIGIAIECTLDWVAPGWRQGPSTSWGLSSYSDDDDTRLDFEVQFFAASDPKAVWGGPL